MKTIIPTIFTKGVFKPIKRVNFPENFRVEITPLVDYHFNGSPKIIMEMLRITKMKFKGANIKIPAGLGYQKKIRSESDLKVDARLKELNA